MRKRFAFILAAFGIYLIVCVGSILGASHVLTAWNAERKAVQATRQAIDDLTGLHKQEVRAAILLFEQVNSADETDQDPRQLERVMTGKLLERMIRAREPRQSVNDGDDYDLRTRDVSVDCLTVVEYSETRFKAVSWVQSRTIKTTPAGKVLEMYALHRMSKVYVFTKVENKWKAAIFLGILTWDDVVRDWSYAEDWEKELMGELPVDKELQCQ